MKHDTGGKAFPMGYHPEGNSADHPGMTLLDWFAGLATKEDVKHWFDIMWNNDTSVTREQAKYLYASAMLAEKRRREASPPSGPTSSNGQGGGE